MMEYDRFTKYQLRTGLSLRAEYSKDIATIGISDKIVKYILRMEMNDEDATSQIEKLFIF